MTMKLPLAMVRVGKPQSAAAGAFIKPFYGRDDEYGIIGEEREGKVIIILIGERAFTSFPLRETDDEDALIVEGAEIEVDWTTLDPRLGMHSLRLRDGRAAIASRPAGQYGGPRSLAFVSGDLGSGAPRAPEIAFPHWEIVLRSGNEKLVLFSSHTLPPLGTSE